MTYNGILINNNNYNIIFEQIRNKELNTNKLRALKSKNDDEYLVDLKDVIEKVLNSGLSLNDAMKMLNNIGS